MELKNMSTRRLKRAYLRAMKREWRWMARGEESWDVPYFYQRELSKRQARVKTAGEELRRRGWTA